MASRSRATPLSRPRHQSAQFRRRPARTSAGATRYAKFLRNLTRKVLKNPTFKQELQEIEHHLDSLSVKLDAPHHTIIRDESELVRSFCHKWSLDRIAFVHYGKVNVVLSTEVIATATGWEENDFAAIFLGNPGGRPSNRTDRARRSRAVAAAMRNNTNCGIPLTAAEAARKVARRFDRQPNTLRNDFQDKTLS